MNQFQIQSVMREESKERKLEQRARRVEAGAAYFPQVHSGTGKAESSRPSGYARYSVQSNPLLSKAKAVTPW